jgi:hypothetical protein
VKELFGLKHNRWVNIALLLPTILMTAFFSTQSARAALVWRTATMDGGIAGISDFDLNEDGLADIRIDYGASNIVNGDGPFRLQALDTTLVSASGGITVSYSAGDVVALENGLWVGSGQQILTAGVVLDPLGNVVIDGWGGISYDDIGVPIIPPGGPTYQIDMFLVRLTDGVAWVDLDTGLWSLGVLTANWCYLSPPTQTFVIEPIPESEVLAMLALGIGIIFKRSRLVK